MRLHSEKQAGPRRGNPTAVKTMLRRGQTERDGKAFGDTEQSDRHLTGCWDSCVASEARLSTRGEHGRETGSLLCCAAKRRREAAGSPRCVGVAGAAYRHADALCG